MKKHRRNSLRLQGYDYSEEGAYFVTIVAHNRERLFGSLLENEMRLNEFGRIVENVWNDLPNHNTVELDEFVVMPNHVHGILILSPPTRRVDQETKISQEGADQLQGASLTINPSALSEIVRQFKSFSAKRINQLRNSPRTPIWQRGYYDHIIRSEKDYYNIAEYISLNPCKWDSDTENDPRRGNSI